MKPDYFTRKDTDSKESMIYAELWAVMKLYRHIIGKSLRHKSSQATQVYAELSIEAIRRAMEAATVLIDELENKKDG